jgi:hypothetical protein
MAPYEHVSKGSLASFSAFVRRRSDTLHTTGLVPERASCAATGSRKVDNFMAPLQAADVNGRLATDHGISVIQHFLGTPVGFEHQHLLIQGGSLVRRQ